MGGTGNPPAAATQLLGSRLWYMIRLLIADDRPLIRDGLRRIINDHGELRALGEAANADELVALLQRVHADVVLLDTSLPGPGLVELVEQLSRRRRSPRILVVGARTGDPAVRRALRSGAAGAVSRDDTTATLIDAVRTVAAGKRVVSSLFARKPAPPVPGLSERELEVLRHFGSGRSGREVAEELGLSPKTVSTYRTRILKKLGLHNGGELVRYALERGLAE